MEPGKRDGRIPVVRDRALCAAHPAAAGAGAASLPGNRRARVVRRWRGGGRSWNGAGAHGRLHGAAVALRPRAVFSAANWVPPFVTGAKVQLFHGFNVEKREDARGHFRVRGLFDLYCTQGPATTAPFRAIAARAGHFAVVETGWPKLDPLFGERRDASRALRDRRARGPVVLFASTFTERLSAAPHLLRCDRRGNRPRRPLLAADPASQMRAGIVRALSGAGRRQRRLRGDRATGAAQRAADVLLFGYDLGGVASSWSSASRW